MLIISRKIQEKIVLADQIEITILEIGRNRVRFGINAPKNVDIDTRTKLPGQQPEPVVAGAEEPERSRSSSNVTPFPGAWKR